MSKLISAIKTLSSFTDTFLLIILLYFLWLRDYVPEGNIKENIYLIIIIVSIVLSVANAIVLPSKIKRLRGLIKQRKQRKQRQ